MDGFRSLNMQMDPFLSNEYADVITFLFQDTVKQLSATTHVAFVYTNSYPLADEFSPITFKLDVR